MEERYIRFKSQYLQKEVELLVFGDKGHPVLFFPTALNRYYQAKDVGLVTSIQDQIEGGAFKLFCVDTFDETSWYSKEIAPETRILNYIRYEQFLLHELVPAILKECKTERLIVAGCSFGGYHAANFAFKHPYLVSSLISMSGVFEMKTFTDGYYDDNLYFNNPVDFMQSEQGWRYGHMNIVLGTSEWDICLATNQRISEILSSIGVDHWLNVWGWEKHGWDLWCKMFPNYLSRIKVV